MLLRKILNRFYTFILKCGFAHLGKGTLLYFPITLNNTASIRLGKNITIREHAWLNCAKSEKPTLEIGDHSYLGRFIHINAYKSVKLEESVLIADRVFISDVHHRSDDPHLPILNQGVTPPKSVHLKRGCWIGIGAVIMPGVTIGENAIVAANAVVTRNVPDRMIARGIPATIFDREGNPYLEETK